MRSSESPHVCKFFCDMSSFKKRAKSLKRTHRERGQLGSRQHLGLLEKHKDYVLRARNYQKKQAQLKILHEKARNRNPDEFYYKMISSKLKDGQHIIPQPEEKYSEEQLQLMKTQDLKYVQMKLTTETKKVERLRANLHLLDDDEPPKNTHTIFVDSAEEVSSFDPVKYFDTDPTLVSRSYNRPTLETLSSQEVAGDTSSIHERNEECASSYKELNQRIQRCKELKRAAQKMKLQKDLMGKGQRFKIPGNSSTPATYRWKKERKR